jgi:hypothetical protein
MFIRPLILRASYLATLLCTVAALAVTNKAHAQVATAHLYSEGLTQPAGFFFLPFTWPNASGVWVSDSNRGIQPFAQLPDAPLAYMDTSHIALPVAGPGQPAQPIAGSDPIYYPESAGKSRGVWRGNRDLNLDPAGRPILCGIIAQNKGLGGRNPTASAVGPDGKLYVGFLGSGDIVRIPNPDVGNLQNVESVGKSIKGTRVFSLAFVGADLYVACKEGLGVIQNAAAATGGAEAKPVAGLPISASRAVNGVASDGLDTLYFISGAAVWRYSIGRHAGELFVRSGLLLDGTVYPFSFNNGSTAGIALDPNGTLWIGTDPGTGVIGQGRAWMIATQ